MEIYERAVKANLPQTGESAYQTVASYLKKMEPILKALGRRDEWVQLLMQIRLDYRNRPKFMEILDRMEGRKRTIIESQKTRKGR